MKLPRLLFALGYAGLLPFVAGPFWLSVAPQSAPVWLDEAWLLYAALVAAFMAGSFWGMAVVVAENPASFVGFALSAVLMLGAWGALLLPFALALLALALVFLLLAVAEIWRERALDPSGSYFRLRIALTAGVLVCLAWRLALG